MALKKSLEHLESAVMNQPDSAWAWYHYGEALLRLKRLQEAVTTLRKAVELSPENALFRYDLGLALFDLNQPEAASEQFAAVAAGGTDSKFSGSGLIQAAMTCLALSQEKQGQWEVAIQTLLPAQENAIAVLFNLGFLHFRAGRFDTALPYAHAAFTLKPNNEDIVHQYGAILNELKRPREAVKLLKKATQLEPTCTSAWYDLGIAYARLKHRKRARVCFAKSLQLKPNHAWSYYDLACLDALEGRHDSAFRKLEQAVACGFRNIVLLRQDSDLRSLRRDPRWKSLLGSIEDFEKSNN